MGPRPGVTAFNLESVVFLFSLGWNKRLYDGLEPILQRLIVQPDRRQDVRDRRCV
jgi:hypothetical protein